MIKRFKKFLLATAVGTFSFGASADTQITTPIFIGSVNSASTWYWSGDEHTGLEYELAKAFTEFVDRPVELIVFDDYAQMRVAFDQHVIDIMTGDVAVQGLMRPYHESVGYRNVEAVIIRHDADSQLNEAFPIKVSAGSAYLDHEIKASTKLIEVQGRSNYDLIKSVNEQRSGSAIIDRVSYEQLTALFPRVIAEPLEGHSRDRHWIAKIDSDLNSKIDDFFSEPITQRKIAELVHLEQPQVDPIDYTDARSFTYMMRSRLPRYRSALQSASDASQVPFNLLAALSFQESHWDPTAVSPTGVKGFMMLTQRTAQEMKVTDRLNLNQSAIGGARYLRTLYDRLPERLDRFNRTAFALASYNIGRGHLEDARILAQRHGRNPDSWEQVKPFVLQLEDPNIFTQTKHGYARGRECVTYVENIFQYEQLLSWQEHVDNQFIEGDTRYALSP